MKLLTFSNSLNLSFSLAIAALSLIFLSSANVLVATSLASGSGIVSIAYSNDGINSDKNGAASIGSSTNFVILLTILLHIRLISPLFCLNPATISGTTTESALPSTVWTNTIPANF